MPRSARIRVIGESAVYHIISRTALEGFVLGDTEKDELAKIIKRLSSVYFSEILGFCLMGTHFHILVKMNIEKDYSDEEIQNRFNLYFGAGKRKLMEGQIPFYRNKWENLSEFVKDIKRTFSLYYNKKHNRKGFFWSERFKSVLLEKGETLINCLAYIDLNPVRAGIVNKPEEYRWCSLGYHVQTNNKDNFLSLDFGLIRSNSTSPKKRLRSYREFVYEKGALDDRKGKLIAKKIFEKEKKRGFAINPIDRFKHRTRYFTDSAIIGSKDFVSKNFQNFKEALQITNERKPKTISGLSGVYSLKRLSALI